MDTKLVHLQTARHKRQRYKNQAAAVKTLPVHFHLNLLAVERQMCCLAT